MGPGPAPGGPGPRALAWASGPCLGPRVPGLRGQVPGLGLALGPNGGGGCPDPVGGLAPPSSTPNSRRLPRKIGPVLFMTCSGDRAGIEAARAGLGWDGAWHPDRIPLHIIIELGLVWGISEIA